MTTTQTDSKRDQLDSLARSAAQCTACRLHEGRTHSVFSDGNPDAHLMLIGEGPGQREDETGVPFVGRAGQLLNKILEAVNIDRAKDIYICNIVKCRPPNNRKPMADEMATCTERYLTHQIELIQPRLILLAGATAVQGVLKNKTGITKIRGQIFETQWGIPAMPIYHPSYLLRNPSKKEGSPKWQMWQDIQEVRRRLDAIENGN